MAQTALIDQALTTLKDHGLKYTKKRELLLLFLIRNNRYVSAREIYESMSEKFPGLSYDTVYRNLHEFCELDLVEETELNGEMKFRYQCCHGNVGHHHHFICTVCGKTKELHLCPMDFIAEDLSGCQIENHRFEIFGRCEECQS